MLPLPAGAYGDAGGHKKIQGHLLQGVQLDPCGHHHWQGAYGPTYKTKRHVPERDLSLSPYFPISGRAFGIGGDHGVCMYCL